MIWEPFVLAVFLGLVVSAGLYFAYMWPSVEPDPDAVLVSDAEPAMASADSRDTAEPVAEVKPPVVAEPVDKKKEPPQRPSDADMTPLPPPQPEDDGLS